MQVTYPEFKGIRILHAERVIPHGGNCSGCPMREVSAKHHRQENGFCALLGRGDWMPGLSFLWDGVKECSINLDSEDGDLDAHPAQP